MDKYSRIKCRVLARATGRNIHQLCSLLTVCLSHADIAKMDFPPQVLIKSKEKFNIASDRIFAMTGIKLKMEEFL